jgi:DNA-binding NarL/FixJ family response regulator
MRRLPQTNPPFSGDAIASGPLPAGESAVPTNEPASGVAPLTTRERQILELLARGLQNREIGAQLGISGVTVKNHLYRVFEKLGTRTRTEAVLKWLGR